MFCDIHTHNTNPRFPSLVDVSGSEDFVFSGTEAHFSMGIHPQSITDDYDMELRLTQIRHAAAQGRIHAIGECGLDKFATCGRELSLSTFARQVDIASEYGLPIVVHCVRLYSDVISVIKKRNFHNPVILHSYNGNRQITEQLLRMDNVYFSFRQLENKTGLKSIDIIPVERILLESDTMDAPDFGQSCDTISALKKITPKSLEDIIYYNYVKIIGGY